MKYEKILAVDEGILLEVKEQKSVIILNVKKKIRIKLNK